jgi:hypothetical protein
MARRGDAGWLRSSPSISSINCLISSMDHDANISATSNSSADFVELTGIDISAG